MTAYVLDTTVVIDHVDDYVPASNILAKIFEETIQIYTCDVVTCEALSGGDDTTVAARLRLLNALEYVALAPEGARWAGRQRRRLRAEGRRAPGTTDALIAALAHSLDATVVTRNARDFSAFDIPVLGYGDPALD
ncbi:MAG TPA: type II toxin-antitoxin system VapC family toxin [Candidatus Limnocylindria bacterium]|nr:type II toxin-antitoxin system VapC family toxin [Candidatus Limnocylindria bacterium]